MEDFDRWRDKDNIYNYEIDYKKGLGSLESTEFEQLIKNTRLISFDYDDNANHLINDWFDTDLSDKRKEIILK